MKSIEFFKTGEEASRRQQFLAKKGISTKVMVDPLESRFPELCSFAAVGLYVVDDDSTERARSLLNGEYKAA